MALGQKTIAKNSAGLFGHRVIAAGEDINCGITTLGPGVDRDVRFSEQGQSRDALGLEAVSDQVEKSGTSTLRCCRDGGSQKCFVVEPAGIALVELEDAVLADHVGGLMLLGVPPSRVGMQGRQGLLHQAVKKQHVTLSDVRSGSQVSRLENL